MKAEPMQLERLADCDACLTYQQPGAMNVV